MIDIENELYTIVKTQVKADFPNCDFDIGFNKIATFPHVTMEEKDNSVYIRTQTEIPENHAFLMYEFNIYSNSTKGKKEECKSIVKVIDEIMGSYNFTRLTCSRIPNVEDATIYRMVTRYSGVVDRNKTLYRR